MTVHERSYVVLFHGMFHEKKHNRSNSVEPENQPTSIYYPCLTNDHEAYHGLFMSVLEIFSIIFYFGWSFRCCCIFPMAVSGTPAVAFLAAIRPQLFTCMPPTRRCFLALSFVKQTTPHLYLSISRNNDIYCCSRQQSLCKKYKGGWLFSVV